jgi:methyltransferase
MVISLNVYLAILVALAGERLFELALSRRNARRALAAGAVEVARVQYALIATFHTLFIVSAAAEAVLLKRPFPGALGWAALCGAILAQALRYWSVATLGWRWNTRIIVLPGTAPLVRGPYRYIRHPNYAAVILEIAFVPLIHGCWLVATIFSAGNAALLAARIRTEEAAMGARYAVDFSSTPRFIPRLISRAPGRPAIHRY